VASEKAIRLKAHGNWGDGGSDGWRASGGKQRGFPVLDLDTAGEIGEANRSSTEFLFCYVAGPRYQWRDGRPAGRLASRPCGNNEVALTENKYWTFGGFPVITYGTIRARPIRKIMEKPL
jgi:hypothetical protein